MSTTSFKGIVLNSIDYEDNHQVLTIFSDKYGKIGMVALGVNKPTSKNKYALQTFNLSEFEIFKSRQKHTLSKLKTAVLIKDHFEITKNYDNYMYISAIGKIIEQATLDRQKNFRIYTILLNFLEKINLNENPFSNFVLTLFKLIQFFGGDWILNQCYRCYRSYKFYRAFNFEDYGLVCPNCVREDDSIQSAEFVSYVMKLKTTNLETDEIQIVPIKYHIYLVKHLLNYYEQTLGIWNPILEQIKEKEFVKNLKNV
ncbi:DNA repair protein RecO [Williamsoniiplasma luminosum]|uniref:DNA repair protein RecO n=1 Tax=Williamsoniiplasma luminosum TaxID=214888 RepID=A0A2S0NJH8_9MOLU|nr:DNA repair protein RecO [Williamsoniiplasma luminosum]AVP49168.1 MAG: DNA repair protein RecO [Williamsoniiplasma luminosum]